MATATGAKQVRGNSLLPKKAAAPETRGGVCFFKQVAQLYEVTPLSRSLFIGPEVELTASTASHLHHGLL